MARSIRITAALTGAIPLEDAVLLFWARKWQGVTLPDTRVKR
jgi:hypothetical protein